MEIKIKFRDSDARMILYFLRAHYKSKASLDKLAKTAIREIVAEQARAESEEAAMMMEVNALKEKQ